MTCTHDRIKFVEWDYGISSETGYHDAGEEFECLDCGERFTGAEWDREMDAILAEMEARKRGRDAA